MGKLFVIDGLDGSGKSTQLELLDKRLHEQGIANRQISFPDYGQPSSALVSMYLHGELGGSADAVNAFAASSFYAVDRYASFKRFWQEDYAAGVPMIAARYTTSNAIHQMTKLPMGEWDAFLKWLDDYEYVKLGLPRPDGVCFLDMPPEVSQKLLLVRYDGDSGKKDIHERDREYLQKCRTAALFAAERLGWTVVPCSDGTEPLPINTINDTLYDLVVDFINSDK